MAEPPASQLPPPPPRPPRDDRPPVPDGTETKERLLAALSHLGVPLYGPILPGLLFIASNPSSYRRRHASAAFSFQLVFIACWVVLVALLAVGRLDPLVLVFVLAAVLVVELPNVALALLGREPIRMAPFRVLHPDD